MRHQERHYSERIGWLRAVVLGANDGILSTASVMLGVAGSGQGAPQIIIAGIAGLVAGAMSMAAGEYVSVSSQADTEQADLARERDELARDSAGEHQELVSLYRARGLDVTLAEQVATQLMAHDALGTHARDELGISEGQRARPITAALASALSFAIGAIVPLAVGMLIPLSLVTGVIVVISLLALAVLGALAAKTGGAHAGMGALRVTFWGAMAMAITYAIGALFGTVV